MSDVAPPKTAPDAEAPPQAEADAAAPDAKAPDAETAAAAPDGAAAPGKKKVIRRVVKNTYSTDPALYIYTTLTAGSSHTVTATSRLETILRANRVPFKALDLATDEKARMLWGRRAGKDAKNRPRKLPALVQMGMVLGVCLTLPLFLSLAPRKPSPPVFTGPPITQASTAGADERARLTPIVPSVGPG